MNRFYHWYDEASRIHVAYLIAEQYGVDSTAHWEYPRWILRVDAYLETLGLRNAVYQPKMVNVAEV